MISCGFEETEVEDACKTTLRFLLSNSIIPTIMAIEMGPPKARSKLTGPALLGASLGSDGLAKILSDHITSWSIKELFSNVAFSDLEEIVFNQAIWKVNSML